MADRSVNCTGPTERATRQCATRLLCLLMHLAGRSISTSVHLRQGVDDTFAAVPEVPYLQLRGGSHSIIYVCPFLECVRHKICCSCVAHVEHSLRGNPTQVDGLRDTEVILATFLFWPSDIFLPRCPALILCLLPRCLILDAE